MQVVPNLATHHIYVFDWLHSVFYFFFLYESLSFLCTVFDVILSNIEEILSINPSTNVFVFGDFNIHKHRVTYSDGTADRPVNPAIIFSSQMSLLRGCSHGGELAQLGRLAGWPR